MLEANDEQVCAHLFELEKLSLLNSYLPLPWWRAHAEVLISRLVDRALRPLFPDDYHADTILQISLISAEENVLPDALACLAASAAVAVSDIPFNGPTSEVRVARLNGSWVINPNLDVLADADIDLMVAGTMDSIVMVEGEMQEVSEGEMVDAIEKAHEAL